MIHLRPSSRKGASTASFQTLFATLIVSAVSACGSPRTFESVRENPHTTGPSATPEDADPAPNPEDPGPAENADNPAPVSNPDDPGPAANPESPEPATNPGADPSVNPDDPGPSTTPADPVPVATPDEAVIRLATFNVLNYGHAEPAVPTADRNPVLRSFLASHLGGTDVFVFQEVIDKEAFQEDVLPDGYSCRSYNSWSGHQHVMICYRNDRWRFVKSDGEWDYAMKSVAFGGYRPAVHGVLVDRESGEKRLKVIGVHLKASPSHSETRLKQIHKLAAELVEAEDDVPVVLTGDFNYASGDVESFGEAFDEHGIALKALPRKITFNSGGFFKRRFDNFWTSPELEVVGSQKVSRQCSDPFGSSDGINNIHYFNNFVSDHCPVTLTVSP